MDDLSWPCFGQSLVCKDLRAHELPPGGQPCSNSRSVHVELFCRGNFVCLKDEELELAFKERRSEV